MTATSKPRLRRAAIAAAIVFVPASFLGLSLADYSFEVAVAHYFGLFLVLPIALFDALTTNTDPDRALSDSFLLIINIAGQYVWYLFLSYAGMVTY